MKKNFLRRALSALITVIMIAVPVISLLPLTATAAESNVVTFESPAITANANSTVDLSKYSVEFKKDTATAGASITWSSTQLTVSGKKVTPKTKGVYTLTAKNGSNTKTVYLVVKNSSETEYVLYENNFSSAAALTNGELTKQGNASASITNGELVLNTTSEEGKLFLPAWLGDFGNYAITANVNVATVNNDTRWVALMNRYSSSSNFFQLCVRKNATASNGVELSCWNGSWQYPATGANSAALKDSGYDTLKIEVYDNRAVGYVNGSAVVETNTLSDYGIESCGKVGINASGCIAKFNDIKVTAQLSAPKFTGRAYTRAISSNLNLAPSMVYEITGKSDLNNILTNSPAVAIMTVDRSGNVVDSNENIITSAEDAVSKLGGSVIPAFKPVSTAVASMVLQKLNALNLPEYIYISTSAVSLKQAGNLNKKVTCVYDMTATATKNTTIESIRENTLKANCYLCILPASLATSKNTNYLNSLGVAVWYDAKQNTTAEYFNLVTSGANGIIASKRADLEKVISSSIFKSNTIIRPTGVVGHRGTPALSPENTIESSILAAKNGATVIENDIRLTKDDVVVVIHNADLATQTTAPSGYISDYTYAELTSKYKVDGSPEYADSTTYNGAQYTIPTLEDYLKTFQNTDTFLFIEIKGPDNVTTYEKIKNVMLPKLKKLLVQYDMTQQVGVIAFNPTVQQDVRLQIPEVSVGMLTGDTQSFDALMTSIRTNGTTFNPSTNLLSAELVRRLFVRGVLTYPWTYRGIHGHSALFDQHIRMGIAALTTDNSYFAKDYIRFLDVNKYVVQTNVNKKVALKLTAEKYGAVNETDFKNNTLDATSRVSMYEISGNNNISYNTSTGEITASAKGIYNILFSIDYTMNDETTVSVYSQPVAVYVDTPIPKEEPETTKPTQKPTSKPTEQPTEAPTDDTATSTDDLLTDSLPDETVPSDPSITETEFVETQATAELPDVNKNGCGSTLASATAAIAVTAILSTGIAVKAKKKKKQ